MKILTCELHPVALAALLLGVFSLNPMAKAQDPVNEPAPGASDTKDPSTDPWLMSGGGSDALAMRDGIKYSELKSMKHTDVSIKIRNGQLVFSGLIPKGCIDSASLSDDDTANGQHAVKLSMPNCPGGDLKKLAFNPDAQKLVHVSDYLKPVTLNMDVDGPVCLAYTLDTDVSCDVIPGLKTTAQADAAEAAKELKKQQDADAKKAWEESAQRKDLLIQEAQTACESGDKATFTAALSQLTVSLTQISKYVKAMDAQQQKALLANIKKGKDVDAVRSAFSAYLASAQERGHRWDTEDAAKAYAVRRMDLMRQMLADSDVSASDKADAIADLRDDLVELVDDLQSKEVKENIYWAYNELASKLKDDGKYDDAEKYYNLAENFATASEKVQIETDMAKMYNNAADKCLEDNKLNPGKCDRLAEKARKHMDGAIAAQGKVGGDGIDDMLNQMKVERITSFGAQGGPSINIKASGMNFGVYNQSEWTARKMQVLQQGRAEQAAQQQLQMQMQQQGGMQNGTGAGNGSIFR